MKYAELYATIRVMPVSMVFKDVEGRPLRSITMDGALVFERRKADRRADPYRWIAWTGWDRDKPPIGDQTLVLVHLRGSTMPEKTAMPAGLFRWTVTGSAGDIVSYKVVKE